MIGERRGTLLRAAAKALGDQRDPFDTSFLVANDVTADECMDLSDALALGAKLVVLLSAQASKGGPVGRYAASVLVEAME